MACRLTSSPPTLDRLGRSCRSRATVKLLAGVALPTASVCMFRKPTVTSSETLPDSRAPPRM
ncbi:MAG: hypothetical protein J4G16_07155, partial [Acidobacteria bacterium]|nr:hypothetical protein [Acidobacteriota bacterium]